MEKIRNMEKLFVKEHIGQTRLKIRSAGTIFLYILKSVIYIRYTYDIEYSDMMTKTSRNGQKTCSSKGKTEIFNYVR